MSKKGTARRDVVRRLGLDAQQHTGGRLRFGEQVEVRLVGKEGPRHLHGLCGQRHPCGRCEGGEGLGSRVDVLRGGGALKKPSVDCFAGSGGGYAPGGAGGVPPGHGLLVVGPHSAAREQHQGLGDWACSPFQSPDPHTCLPKERPSHGLGERLRKGTHHGAQVLKTHEARRDAPHPSTTTTTGELHSLLSNGPFFVSLGVWQASSSGVRQCSRTAPSLHICTPPPFV